MINIQNVKFIDSNDLDRLVVETYGRPYCLQQQDGCQDRGITSITVPGYAYDYENDTILEEVNGDEMGVSLKAWSTRDPKQKLDTEHDWDKEHGINMFWRRNFYPELQTLVNDLHTKGLIPAGDYKINIDW